MWDHELDVIYTEDPRFDVPFCRNQSGVDADICFEATTYCNVACANCFSESLPSRPGQHLPLQSIVDHLTSSRSGLLRACITGGEPLMHPDIKGILELPSRYCDVGFVLTTNGTIQPSLDVAMAHHGWLVCVSIHGTREAHNEYERHDTHGLAVARLCNLSEQGATTHIYAVLHRKFRTEDLEFLLQLRERCGARMLRLIVPRPYGRHESVNPVESRVAVAPYLSKQCVLVCESSGSPFVDVRGERRTSH